MTHTDTVLVALRARIAQPENAVNHARQLARLALVRYADTPHRIITDGEHDLAAALGDIDRLLLAACHPATSDRKTLREHGEAALRENAANEHRHRPPDPHEFAGDPHHGEKHG